MPVVKQWLQQAFDLFIFTSLFIALCAVGMAYQTALLFKLSQLQPFYAFVFCGTVCSYNVHWALTPKLFQNPMLPPSGLDRIPVWWHIVVAAVALVLAALLFLRMRQHWFWLMGAGLLSFLYTAPKLQTKATLFLRRIAYGKTIFLTLAWTYITAVLPFIVANAPLQTTAIAFCVNRFFLICAICILFDLRDRDVDRQQGIKSMITALDAPAITRIYFGALAAFFISAAWLFASQSWLAVAALVIPAIILWFGYSWFKSRRSAFVYNFVLDGLMVFSLPLLLLFRY